MPSPLFHNFAIFLIELNDLKYQSASSMPKGCKSGSVTYWHYGIQNIGIQNTCWPLILLFQTLTYTLWAPKKRNAFDKSKYMFSRIAPCSGLLTSLSLFSSTACPCALNPWHRLLAHQSLLPAGKSKSGQILIIVCLQKTPNNVMMSQSSIVFNQENVISHINATQVCPIDVRENCNKSLFTHIYHPPFCKILLS